MKKLTLTLGLIASLSFLHAQTSNLGQPASYSKKIALGKKGYQLPNFNNFELLNYYENQAQQNGTKLMQYGEPHDVSINFFNQAERTILPNGNSVYQFYIQSENALSLNVIFTKFNLAQGTILYLFNEAKTKYIGAYTSLNNNAAQQLGTELLYDNKIYIEVQEPKENIGKSTLEIGRVVHGFIHLDNHMDKSLNDSGDCEIDVNCPQGSGWELQRNGVGMLVNGGGGFCSGGMVNNTAGATTPYFLTANHCGNDPSAWIFRFRWESPEGQEDCGTTNPSVNGPQNMNVNGGVTRASYAPSDFHLIELNAIPDQTWDVVYNGWDHSGNPPSSGAGIHHPAGDIKKISLSANDYVAEPYTSAAADHWHVFWTDGVTEGGSSGSPIFNEYHRVVGQLHGGASFCGGSDLSDFYGMFSVSWDGGGTPSTRLSDWLDPQSTGVPFIDANVTNSLDPFFTTSVEGVQGTLCSADATPYVVLTNGGSVVMTDATINYTIDGTSDSFPWTGNLGLFESDTVYIPVTTFTAGSHTLTVTVTNPNNGQTDENMNNNGASTTFNVVIGGNMVNLQFNFDCYANETSWEIQDSNNDVIFQGGNYDNNNQTEYTLEKQVCLNNGCYDLIIHDSYGDGMTSSGCNDGSVYVTYNGDTLTELAPADANFGNQVIKNFCLNQQSSVTELDENLVSIYPNPFTNEFTVNAHGLEIKNIAIYDVSGKEIMAVSTNNVMKQNISFNPKQGTYILKVETSNGIIVKKLIK